MAFAHLYPWQLITKTAKIGLSVQLPMPQKVAPQLLHEETERIIASFAPAEQFGYHHAGGWKAIGLVSCGGDPYEDRQLDGPYLKTPALKMSPILEALIDSFKCDKKRVRLSKLEPGHNIFWHYDPESDKDRLARLPGSSA